MGRTRPTRDMRAGPTEAISRTRRAQLVAEFESELGVDHKARAKAAADERRWIRIKTFIVWSVAVIFFTIACQKLWQMGERVDQPFSTIEPDFEILTGDGD